MKRIRGGEKRQVYFNSRFYILIEIIITEVETKLQEFRKVGIKFGNFSYYPKVKNYRFCAAIEVENTQKGNKVRLKTIKFSPILITLLCLQVDLMEEPTPIPPSSRLVA